MTITPRSMHQEGIVFTMLLDNLFVMLLSRSELKRPKVIP